MRAKKFSGAIVAVTVVVLALAIPAAASAAWGAIALNPDTGQAGIASNEQTKGDANKAAVKDCPGKCVPALFVRNKCGAIAANARRFFPGFGNSKHEAVEKAKKKASKGPGGLELVAFVCSG